VFSGLYFIELVCRESVTDIFNISTVCPEMILNGEQMAMSSASSNLNISD